MRLTLQNFLASSVYQEQIPKALTEDLLLLDNGIEEVCEHSIDAKKIASSLEIECRVNVAFHPLQLLYNNSLVMVKVSFNPAYERMSCW
ncbi:hypothetical protein V2G26_014784 [Clonostachys chloroleuca]